MPTHNLENVTTLAKIALYRLMDKDFVPNKSLTPTQWCLLHTLSSRENADWWNRLPYLQFCSGYSKWLNDPKLRTVFSNVVQAERYCDQHGYTTFLHGQDRDVAFLLHLYTRLWHLQCNKVSADYLFPFIRGDENVDKDHEVQMREQLINGRYVRDYTHGYYVTKNLLFASYALLTSPNAPTANPGSFFMRANSVFGCKLTTKEVLSTLQLNHLHEKYKHEIAQLSHEYKMLSEYGHLLMLAVPRDMVASTVYSTDRAGNPNAISFDEETTSQADKVVQRFCSSNPRVKSLNGLNFVRFAIPMTFDRVLDPHSGVKVVSIEATDRKKLADFNRRLNNFVEQVRADLSKS